MKFEDSIHSLEVPAKQVWRKRTQRRRRPFRHDEDGDAIQMATPEVFDASPSAHHRLQDASCLNVIVLLCNFRFSLSDVAAHI
jgi:hypothetical protein